MEDPTTEPVSSEYHYWAFISYSHKDQAFTARLLKALERYRLPPRLVGRETPYGPVPRRLVPICRDREEFPASADLGESVLGALRASRCLIVVCSPNSAKSRWVNEEVRSFKRMGRANRIYCVIVDGEPNTAEKGLPPERECYVPALLCDPEEEKEEAHHDVEPIGADPQADGWHRSVLKVVAGITGVGLDDLIQRDRQRHRTERLIRVSAAVLVLCVFSSLLLLWHHQRVEAEKRGRDAEVARQGESDARAAAEESQRETERAESGETLALAAKEFKENNISQARELLTQVSAKHRDWVWHYLMSVSDGSERVVSLHQRGILAMAANDRLLATGDTGGRIHTWDLAELAPRQAISHHRQEEEDTLGLPAPYAPWEIAQIRALAFLDNGERIATGDSQGKVTLYRISGPPASEVLDFRDAGNRAQGRQRITGLVDLGEGHLAIAIDNEIIIYDLSTHAVIHRAQVANREIAELGISTADNGEILVSAGGNQLFLWDSTLQAAVKRPWGYGMANMLSCFSAAVTKPFVVTGHYNGQIIVRDALGKIHSEPQSAHTGEVRTVAINPKGTLVASASEKTIRVWTVRIDSLQGIHLTHLTDLIGHPQDVTALRFGSDDNTLYSTDADGELRRWSLRRHGIKHTMVAEGFATTPFDICLRTNRMVSPERPVRSMDPNPSGEGNLLIHQLDTGALALKIPDLDSPPGHLEIASTGNRFLIIGQFQLKIWDFDEQKWVFQNKQVFSRSITGGTLNPNGDLVALHGQKEVIVQDVVSGAVRHRLSTNQSYAIGRSIGCFSPDSRWLFVATGNKLLGWDLETAQMILEEAIPGEDSVYRMTLSPTSTHLAYGTMTGNSIYLKDLSHLENPPEILKQHDGLITALAFSPNGQWLLSGTSRSVVRLWNVAAGQSIVSLNKEPSSRMLLGVEKVAWDPEGLRVVAIIGTKIITWNPRLMTEDHPSVPTSQSVKTGSATL